MHNKLIDERGELKIKEKSKNKILKIIVSMLAILSIGPGVGAEKLIEPSSVQKSPVQNKQYNPQYPARLDDGISPLTQIAGPICAGAALGGLGLGINFLFKLMQVPGAVNKELTEKTFPGVIARINASYSTLVEEETSAAKSYKLKQENNNPVATPSQIKDFLSIYAQDRFDKFYDHCRSTKKDSEEKAAIIVFLFVKRISDQKAEEIQKTYKVLKGEKTSAPIRLEVDKLQSWFAKHNQVEGRKDEFNEACEKIKTALTTPLPTANPTSNP